MSMGLMVMAMQQDDSVHRLSIGGLTFQPAQLGISSGVILIAWLLQSLPKLHRWFGSPFMRIGIIAVISAVPFLMVMKMGDMGSAMVWIPVAIVALLGRFERPFLPGFQGGEAADENTRGRPDQRRHPAGKVPGRTDSEAGGCIDQLLPEMRVVVDRFFENEQGGGPAFLAAVAEG